MENFHLSSTIYDFFGYRTPMLRGDNLFQLTGNKKQIVTVSLKSNLNLPDYKMFVLFTAVIQKPLQNPKTCFAAGYL